MIKSVYIHIPFCTTICSYCDFPKLYYDKCWIDKYLDALNIEIEQKYQNEEIETLYIGGGTPSSLNIEELTKLFKIINKFKLSSNYEFTIECNLENLNLEKLQLLKQNKVNRLSIGVQTFNQDSLKFLNRRTCDTSIVEEAKKMFDNINIDLIYALPNQTIDELKEDLKNFLKLDISHISTYSLMIENNTLLSIQKTIPVSEDLDLEMYNLICETLKQHGYKHYEISNFARNEKYSKHNLAYWNNNCYYGFGLGASGYIDNIRYTNTKSITKYINHNFHYEKEELNDKMKQEYELILGLRKLDGVSLKQFKDRYKKELTDVFNIDKLLQERKLILENDHLKIPEECLYLSNDILVNFIGD